MDLDKNLMSCLGDPRWRLNNLYKIVDKDGRLVQFQMNDAQLNLYNNLHYLNLILKARQLGFTTFIQLFMLDACLFNSNIRAGTIAHTIDDAKIIFRDKIKVPYENLPAVIQKAVPIVQDNLTELLLKNNSSIRVGVSLRSGTLQYLHVSEYGKICAKYPEKALEIRTGSLNTLHKGQLAFIESTAEGREGHFYELCEDARAKLRNQEKLTPLDWKFTFWPWYDDQSYRLKADFHLPAPLIKYFDELEQVHGIKLDPEQKAWYSKKFEVQLAEMKREYPSTPDEAFEASLEGAYFGAEMAQAEFEGRVSPEHFPVVSLPVHTVWDIGVKDYTSIWFFQLLRDKILLAGYYQNSGAGMPHYVDVLVEFAQRLGWRYGKHWFPHDAKVREWGTGRTRLEQLIDKGIRPSIVPSHNLEDGINAARAILGRCYFNKPLTVEGVRALKAFRKEWNDELGCWRDVPRRDWAKHGADAFRYLAMAYREEREQVRDEPVEELGLKGLTLDKLFTDRDNRQTARMI